MRTIDTRRINNIRNTPRESQGPDPPSTSVRSMGARRARGSAVGSPQINGKVDASAKAVLDHHTKLLGISQGQYLEALLLHAAQDVDQRGVPTWWTRPIPQTEGLLDAS